MRSLCLALLAAVSLEACGDGEEPSPPEVVVHLLDTDSRADVIGARVLATPGDIEVTTDPSGRATFELRPGDYRFAATAPGLALSGTTIEPDTNRTVTSDVITVADEARQEVDLEIGRIDRDTLNLVSLHDGRDETFTVANCQACHNDRKNEVSDDLGIRPWHALKIHSSTACTWCHRTVDLSNKSGGTVRKQVNVALCVSCHPRYPEFPSSL